MNVPKFLLLDHVRACNLRCVHCRYWWPADERITMGGREFTAARKAEVIADFATLAPEGRVVGCGAEPFTDPEHIFTLTRAARSVGLRFFLVTNGTAIGDGLAERICREGPSELTFSFDGPDAASHDRQRGLHGAFDRMVAGIRAVQRARDRLATGPRLFAAVLVQECSYRRLAEFYDLTLGTLGLEKCKLNFLQPTFGGDVSRDEYFAAAIIRDPDELLRVIRACDQEFLLRLRPAWYRTVELWARALAADPEAWRGYWGKQLPESICNAADRNIAIDSWGKMRLCFAYMWGWITWSRAGDLWRFWENDAPELRDAMRGCARYCGISHSLRRESATVEDNGT